MPFVRHWEDLRRGQNADQKVESVAGIDSVFPVITRVFVNPEPGIISPQAIACQRALGWNWANTIGVTHFHALLAIAAPVLLTEMLFPKQRSESWAGTPVLWICGLVMLVWPFVLGRVADYVPPAPAVLSAVLLTGLFIAAGLAMPARIFSSQRRRAWHPFWLFLVCMPAMTLVMIGSSAIPDGASPPPLPALLGTMIAVILIEFFLLAFLTCGDSFGDRHRLSMVLGWMMFFLLFTAAREIEAKEITQRGFAAGLTLLVLLFLRIRYNHTKSVLTLFLGSSYNFCGIIGKSSTTADARGAPRGSEEGCFNYGINSASNLSIPRLSTLVSMRTVVKKIPIKFCEEPTNGAIGRSCRVGFMSRFPRVAES